MNQTSDLTTWFAELNHLLEDYRPWWQFRPFHHREMPWSEACPELTRALESLSGEEIDTLATSPADLANWLSPWIPEAQRLVSLSQLPQLPTRTLIPPLRLEVGVPGRKWQQIQRFVAARPASNLPLLEWCAGKGHLGRLLAAIDGCPVTSLEWQQALCESGNELAHKAQLNQSFVRADAFAVEAGEHLPVGGQAVALHACGDLHTTLMRHWVHSHARALTLSPCCYHLIQAEVYRPLSAAAQASRLRLDRADLSVPLQETVTAGRGDRLRRQRELLRRLVFDEWQREARAVDNYLPVPALPRAVIEGPLEEFARRVFAHHGLNSPAVEDESLWLTKGEQRLAQVQRMELVVQLFRRPLELWLVLDRALFLQEQGARVQLGEFCPRSITPRNILIHAARSSASAGVDAGDFTDAGD